MPERIPIHSTERPSEKWDFFYRTLTKLGDKELLEIQGGLLGQPTSEKTQRVLNQHHPERRDLMKKVIDSIIEERLRPSTKAVGGTSIIPGGRYRFKI